jgi:hypothetical protein
MTETTDHRHLYDGTDMFASGIRSRFRWLFFAGMMAVALVFGLTFYFALVANQSALARQVPELEAVAAKMKSLLVMNTLAFVAVIVASFLALSSIVTARTFQPLTLLHRELMTIAGGKLPRAADGRERGPFSELDNALTAAVSCLRDRERKEIEELTRCCEALSRSASNQETVRKLKDLAAAKTAFAGGTDSRGQGKVADAKADPLFIQPL